jgi:hypothetical protein
MILSLLKKIDNRKRNISYVEEFHYLAKQPLKIKLDIHLINNSIYCQDCKFGKRTQQNRIEEKSPEFIYIPQPHHTPKQSTQNM